MQTFLTSPDFADTAAALDRQRLGKQRVETMQILNARAGLSRGWRRHPATLMWAGHEQHLVTYGVAICDEWIARGYQDTCRSKILALAELFPDTDTRPPWLGHPVIHLAHRSSLVERAPEHYAALWPDVVPGLPLIWPQDLDWSLTP